MAYKYAVLGAGRQGCAIAYDLVLHGEASEVLLVDRDGSVVEAAARKINALTKKECVQPEVCGISNPMETRALLKGRQAVVSALPYFLNLGAAEAAVEEGVHFTDLGGNTSVVKKELELDSRAQAAGISLLPDCGLAPGLSNLLAAQALRKFDRTDAIHARCGGLPKNPKPPFFYKFVFSLEGLINEYSGEAICLRNGKVTRIPALSELETVEVPGLGKLEACVTTGGTSTAPESFAGKVRDFDYKTLRHAGHWAAIRAFADVGLFSSEPVEVGGQKVSPKQMFQTLFMPKVRFPEDKDLVVLQVEAEGEKDSRHSRWSALLLDEGDEHFTAMERTTGYPTSATSYLQVRGEIVPGARPIELTVPLDRLFEELKKRGVSIVEKFESIGGR